jgi:hypothetical protein
MFYTRVAFPAAVLNTGYKALVHISYRIKKLAPLHEGLLIYVWMRQRLFPSLSKLGTQLAEKSYALSATTGEAAANEPHLL